MLIPSIDLMGGRIVQLVQGKELKLAFDDFEHWIQRFSSYPMVQLIDLDAAMRQGSNRALIEQIAQRLPCQVGGGIGSIERAQEMLAAGARRVIVGSALFDAAGVAEQGDAQRLVRREFAQELRECGRCGASGLQRGHTRGAHRDQGMEAAGGPDAGDGDGGAGAVLRRVPLHAHRSRRHHAGLSSGGGAESCVT